MKILVTKFRHIGDVLLSTPLFASLKAIYPDSELHVSVNDFCAQIVEDNLHVDRVIPYHRDVSNKQRLWKRIKKEFDFYRQFIGQYDLVINLTEGDRGCIIAALSGASRRMGYIKKKTPLVRLARFNETFNFQGYLPTVEKDLQFAKAIDQDKVVNTVSLGWNEHHENRVNSLLRQLNITEEFVLVHPVSRWLSKCWDSHKVAKCIDHLQSKWNKTVLVDDPLLIQKRSK